MCVRRQLTGVASFYVGPGDPPQVLGLAASTFTHSIKYFSVAMTSTMANIDLWKSLLGLTGPEGKSNKWWGGMAATGS